jgi:hypothetical protein
MKVQKKQLVSNMEDLLLSLDVGLTAAPSSNVTKNNSNIRPTAEESIPYVIGDDDDSDSDDLVDIDEDDYPDDLEDETDDKEVNSKST